MKDICLRWKVDIIVLQETKMSSLNMADAKDIWGRRSWDYIHLNAVNAAGGILVG